MAWNHREIGREDTNPPKFDYDPTEDNLVDNIVGVQE